MSGKKIKKVFRSFAPYLFKSVYYQQHLPEYKSQSMLYAVFNEYSYIRVLR